MPPEALDYFPRPAEEDSDDVASQAYQPQRRRWLVQNEAAWRVHNRAVVWQQASTPSTPSVCTTVRWYGRRLLRWFFKTPQFFLGRFFGGRTKTNLI